MFQFLMEGKSNSFILSLYTVFGFKVFFKSDRSYIVAKISSIIEP